MRLNKLTDGKKAKQERSHDSDWSLPKNSRLKPGNIIDSTEYYHRYLIYSFIYFINKYLWVQFSIPKRNRGILVCVCVCMCIHTYAHKVLVHQNSFQINFTAYFKLNHYAT